MAPISLEYMDLGSPTVPSPCGWGSHGGHCDRVTNNSYVSCSEHPIENAWDFWASEKVKRAEEIGYSEGQNCSSV
jgi:hypothetical protein